MQHPIWLVGLYVFGALLTSGFYLRQAPRKLRNGAIIGVAWPGYWMIVHGISGTIMVVTQSLFTILHSLLDNLSAIVDKVLVYVGRVITVYEEGWITVYIVIAIFTPGVIVYDTWTSCTGAIGCGLLIAKSVGWGLVWPSYLVAAAF
jgi:hypothetical protein